MSEAAANSKEKKEIEVSKTILPEKATSKGYLSISSLDPRKINNKDAQLFRRKNFGFIYQDSIKNLIR